MPSSVTASKPALSASETVIRQDYVICMQIRACTYILQRRGKITEQELRKAYGCDDIPALSSIFIH